MAPWFAGIAIVCSLTLLVAPRATAAGAGCAQFGDDGRFCFGEAGLSVYDEAPLAFVEQSSATVVTLHHFERSPCEAIKAQFPEGVEASLRRNVHEADWGLWSFETHADAGDKGVRFRGKVSGRPDYSMALVGGNMCRGAKSASIEAYFLVVSRDPDADLAPIIAKVEAALKWPSPMGSEK